MHLVVVAFVNNHTGRILFVKDIKKLNRQAPIEKERTELDPKM